MPDVPAAEETAKLGKLTAQRADDAVEYRLGRGIDYLGSIARMLRDLSGFATLVYELLQNADDDPRATTARFDITPEALIVWNDGQFSDCGSQDLHKDSVRGSAIEGSAATSIGSGASHPAPRAGALI